MREDSNADLPVDTEMLTEDALDVRKSYVSGAKAKGRIRELHQD
jgi:hypothetical protein